MGGFAIVDPNASGFQQTIANGLTTSHAKIVPTMVGLTLNFNPVAAGGSGPNITVPTLQLQQLNKLALIQTIYIDQSQNDNPVVLSIPGSQQTITAKGRTQGFYPLLYPQGLTALNFTTALGAGLMPVILINVAIQGVVWSTQ